MLVCKNYMTKKVGNTVCGNTRLKVAVKDGQFFAKKHSPGQGTAVPGLWKSKYLEKPPHVILERCRPNVTNRCKTHTHRTK